MALATAGVVRAQSVAALYLLAATPGYQFFYTFGSSLYSVDASGNLVRIRQLLQQPSSTVDMSTGVVSIMGDGNGHLFVVGPLGALKNGLFTTTVVGAKAGTAGVQLTYSVPKMCGYLEGLVPVSLSDGETALDEMCPFHLHAPTTIGRLIVSAGSTRLYRQSGSWSDYDRLRFSGSAMGAAQSIDPTAQIQRSGLAYFNFGLPRSSEIDDTDIICPLPPDLPANIRLGTPAAKECWPAGSSSTCGGGQFGTGVTIIASTERYLIFEVMPENHSNSIPDAFWNPATAYAYDRTLRKWQTFQLPAPIERPASRIFGDWLTTPVQIKRIGNTEHPGAENERDQPSLIYPATRRMYQQYASDVYMPGEVLLRNLADGRVITLQTGQEDSEALDVNAQGDILYRVNNQIFFRHITGTALGPARLVAEGPDVPEVHWAFYYSHGASAAASGKENSDSDVGVGERCRLPMPQRHQSITCPLAVPARSPRPVKTALPATS